ncbi:Type I restriction-modification system specificity subunit [Bacillus cereus 95/8201]|uniref:restriction endonuclease subunit S n=1 Tax=Bacillus cereus group TaxID=86661 RepID=UPI0001A08FFE|nr:restriction endonuclease subunit S [Bacillus cereus]AJH62571.1 type I restriction modification DNA specificity domain protein [Bacillus cereus]AJK32334.1 type I restriction modification DNA specificity domain protein [Bacillus cereus]EEL18432.1 Type I restriction-modification system specificity subunit [Bacillus cereus 95/8201]KWU67994.1 restriction endonuclease subunit S [Bacillus cereus]MCU5695719.1 restriction endonuclease subunit S [Bacillus cereus]
MKLEDIVTVRVGRNLSRGNERNDLTLVAYSFEDLTNDLNGSFLDSQVSLHSGSSNHKDGYLSSAGDVIFSFVSSKSGIVSELNQGKIISQNFAKLIIEHDDLDSSYLCYILNESYSMRKQMAISMQGSNVPKLTPAILKELEIELPSIEKQRKIGKAYFFLRKRQTLAKKQIELEEQLYLKALRQLDQ